MPRTLSSARHARLAELVAQYRQEARLTQAQVAAALDRHQPFISGIEAGQRRVDLVELLELAQVIGFDPHEIVTELLKTES